MSLNYREKDALSNHIILIFLTLVILIPIIILLFNSVKPKAEFGFNPLGFPNEIRLMNYVDAFIIGNYGRVMVNSLIFVIGTLALCITFSSMAAFSLSVLSPKGKLSTIVGVYLLVGVSIPAQLFILPLFILWKNLHLFNTYIGLIIIYTALNAPFAVFLIRSYMIKLPYELFEAARIDGATTLQLFTKIALPLSWPVLLTSGLIVSITVWNEFLFAVTFIHEESARPISSILYSFQASFNRNNYALICAASIMMAAPVAILFILFQRKFIDGLTSGATKG